MTLIEHDAERGAHAVESDPWTHVADDAPLPAAGDVIVSLSRLAELGEVPGRLGVRVEGSADPALLEPHLDRISLIAVDLPKFTDGRAYSLARLLRDRHAYEGGLRAGGHVLRDQIFYLWRCGFDSFELLDGKEVDDAIAAFADFATTYQPAEDHHQPSWRRRRIG